MRLAVHSHYGDELVHSMTVGITHWEELGAERGRAAGPIADALLRPRSRCQTLRGVGPRRAAEQGRRRLAPILRVDGGWLEVVEDRGFEAVQRVYLDVLEGHVDPKTANVLSLVD